MDSLVAIAGTQSNPILKPIAESMWMWWRLLSFAIFDFCIFLHFSLCYLPCHCRLFSPKYRFQQSHKFIRKGDGTLCMCVRYDYAVACYYLNWEQKAPTLIYRRFSYCNLIWMKQEQFAAASAEKNKSAKAYNCRCEHLCSHWMTNCFEMNAFWCDCGFRTKLKNI